MEILDDLDNLKIFLEKNLENSLCNNAISSYVLTDIFSMILGVIRVSRIWCLFSYNMKYQNIGNLL